MASSCLIQSLVPVFYLVLIFLLGVFVFALIKISRRNVKMYDDALTGQKIMMERQKEAVELLREIRDILKK